MNKTFTTFQPRTITSNAITEPRCFNGMCLIRKYKITVEQVEEPKEVLESRLRELWKNKENWHSSNRDAMWEEAKNLGIVL